MSVEAAAIDRILELSAAGEVDASIAETLALPRDVQLHSLEQYSPHRYRERFQFATSAIDSFIRYTNERSKGREQVVTAVDPDTCTARAVFNLLAEASRPGHGDCTATCTLEPQAMYRWMVSLHEDDSAREQGTVFSQRDLIDAIRDWNEYIENPLKLIDAFQKVSTEHVSNREQQEADASRGRSSMEQIRAKAEGGEIPSEINIGFQPYSGFHEHDAVLSVSCVFRSDEVLFRVKVRSIEALKETIAAEFAEKLDDELDVKPLLGCFDVVPLRD